MGREAMSKVTLRTATVADIPLLARWDLDPAVISATTDNPDVSVAFGEENDWEENIALYQPDVWEYWIAEVDGRPIGAMQMIDPHLEPTHYWGEIEPNLRALDIWIGEPEARGRGYGEEMMRLGIERSFAKPEVTAIIIDPLNSNTRAHKFYQRLGFKPTHRQVFNDEDDCLVHKLTREDWEARRGDA
jgi:aminoglycoside 6'-N-acetyltransferase